jgi:hypothetical protein
MKRKLKIAVDPNTLFANADGIKKVLEEAPEVKAEAEAEGRKPQGVAEKRYSLGTIREGIKKGFRYVGESKDRVLYISIAVVDKILEYCVVMCN